MAVAEPQCPLASAPGSVRQAWQRLQARGLDPSRSRPVTNPASSAISRGYRVMSSDRGPNVRSAPHLLNMPAMPKATGPGTKTRTTQII